MQYELSTEKVPTTGGTYVPLPSGLLLADEPQVKRTRKILLILLGLSLAFAMVSVVAAISGFGIEQHIASASRSSSIGQALVSVLFYGFGILVAYRYYETGLRVFAWLNIIMLILMGIIIILLIFTMIVGMIRVNRVIDHDDTVKTITTDLSVAIVAVIILLVADFALDVFIIEFSFKLARLIDANQHLTTQQV